LRASPLADLLPARIELQRPTRLGTAESLRPRRIHPHPLGPGATAPHSDQGEARFGPGIELVPSASARRPLPNLLDAWQSTRDESGAMGLRETVLLPRPGFPRLHRDTTSHEALGPHRHDQSPRPQILRARAGAV